MYLTTFKHFNSTEYVIRHNSFEDSHFQEPITWYHFSRRITDYNQIAHPICYTHGKYYILDDPSAPLDNHLVQSVTCVKILVKIMK